MTPVELFKVYYCVSLVVKDFLFQLIKSLVLIVTKSVLAVSIVETPLHAHNVILLTTLLKMEVNVNVYKTMHPAKLNVYLAHHYLVAPLALTFILARNVSKAQVSHYKMVSVGVTMEVHMTENRAFLAHKLLAVWAARMDKTAHNAMKKIIFNYQQTVNVYVKLNFTWIKIHANHAQLSSHPVQHVHMMEVNVSLVNIHSKNSIKINQDVFVMIINSLIKIKTANYAIQTKNVFPVKTLTVVQNVTHKNITIQLRLEDNVNVNLDMFNKTMHV